MITFFVPGIPAPQGSKRAFVVAGKARLVESSAKCRPWRDSVRAAALEAMAGAGPIEGPIHLRIRFTMPRPATVPRVRLGWPAAKPDLDKLLRSTFDALSAALYRDDAQVCSLVVAKVYQAAGSPTGALIECRELDCECNGPRNRRGRCRDCGEEG